MSIDLGDMPVSSLKLHMERTFRQLAADKGLEFDVKFDPKLPAEIRTDEKRLQQVVLNLLSNAFKFTSEGRVTLSVRCAESGWSSNHPVLRSVDRAIEISVSDTGIGIPQEKQRLIFEAFQQADGTTSRKYGGTGLGLSISREIARLLGGELQVRSQPGKGSTFTLFIPLEAAAVAAPADFGTGPRDATTGTSPLNWLPAALEVTDDRDNLGKSRFVLIVEDDVTFASILLDLARDAGLKGVVSTTGSGTIALARKLQPDAITLDLGLDDINGFVLLDLLQHDAATKEIPVHVISGADEVSDVTAMGARDITEKPVDHDALSTLFKSIHDEAKTSKRRRRTKPGEDAPPTPRSLPELAGTKMLIVDDDIRNIYSLTSVLESYSVEVLHAERGRDGIIILEETPGIDLALIDIMMPEMDGYETMQHVRSNPATAHIPLIAVTAKAMKGDRQKCFAAGASDYIAKPVDIDLLLALLRVWVTKARNRAGAPMQLTQTAAE